MIPRTQKARSVWALTQQSEFIVPAHQIISTPEQLTDALGAKLTFPAFARPCPIEARHGFVDSRRVDNLDEARAVWAEAIAADPQAEMILMSPISATHSAVVTPGSITFGPGNDGATQGRECVTFPLADCKVFPALWPIAGITETPYLEIVTGSINGASISTYAVQLRNGPAIGGGADDRVPADVTVADVITLDPANLPDALEWESRVKALPLDTVIYHPQGSFTSHYAVHAGKRGLAVFTTRKPEIGEALKANTDKTPYNLDAFRRGVAQGFSADVVNSDPYQHGKTNVRIGLLATHHALALRNTPGSWLLGYGAALLVRYGMAASCGEARYARRGGPGRSEIYQEMLANPLQALKRGTAIYRLFMEHRWNGGIGGRAWADCTKSTLDLDYALRRAYVEGTEQRFMDLIGALHSMANQAHNGGWYLNKFCSSKYFDYHAQAAMGEIVKSATAAWKAYRAVIDPAPCVARWREKRKARLVREGKKRPQLAVTVDTGGDVKVWFKSKEFRFQWTYCYMLKDAFKDVTAWALGLKPWEGNGGPPMTDARRFENPPAFVADMLRGKGWIV